MVRSNDYSPGANRASRSGYSDLSEYTTSTNATSLQKLVSLEISGTNTSSSLEPFIIDLTQAPNDYDKNVGYNCDGDDARDDDDDDDNLSTSAVHQYVVTVHDDQTGIYAQTESVVSEPSYREHSANDASTAPSSYVPTPYTECAIGDHGLPGGRPYRLPVQRARTHVSSEKGHHTMLRGNSSNSKNERGKVIQHKPSILGSLFQCVNPTLPGETDVPMKWMAKTAAMEAMSSNEDALDRVFNTVEKYACQNDGDLGREMRKELRKRGDPQGQYGPPRRGWKSNHCVVPDLSHYHCVMPDLSHWKRSARQHKSTNSEDMLDVVFGEMEHYVCSEAMNERLTRYSTNQKDALDAVFEHFENLTCNDDYTAASLQSRGLRTLHKIPRQNWTPTHTASSKRFGHYPPGADLLERFGRDFERSMCTSRVAQCGHEGDLVDNVFDRLERTTCKDEPPKEGGYFDTSVYDLDDHNSLVCNPSDSKDWHNSSPSHRLIRKPSWGNTKPSKKSNQKIDLSGCAEELSAPRRYPRSDDSYQSSRARAKHSLEKIKAIRERYSSHERYYRDDGHY